MSSLGLIGLGDLGWAVACRLDRCGFDLVVHSNQDEEMNRASLQGWLVTEDPAEMARQCDDIVICVTDGPAVEAVVTQTKGLQAALTEDHLIVDIGTTSPIDTVRLAAGVAEWLGTQVWVDAPVSGGPDAAAEGRLVMFVGGELSDVRRAVPITRSLSKDPHHVGGVGSGQWVKVINQVLALDGLAVLAEAVNLAHSVGIDPNLLPSVLATGYGDSVLLQSLSQAMAGSERGTVGARLRIGAKDLSMILKLASGLGAQVPMSTAAHLLYEKGMESGLGEEDILSIIEVLTSSAVRGALPVPDGTSFVESGPEER